MMDGIYYGHMFGWGAGIMMLLFWAAIIIFLVWLAREMRGKRESDLIVNHSKTALDILKERYAKGEINKEEFEAKKKDLQI